jgi:polar amino acid transport system substrate-binding protein
VTARTAWAQAPRLAGAVAALLAAAACVGQVPGGSPAAVLPTATPPPAAAPGPAPDTGCRDPTASLRPQGPPPAPGAMPAGTYLRAIQDRGQLVAGVSRDTLLFGYLNPASNQLEGFDVDMVRQVAKTIFGDDGHVRFRVVSDAQALPALRDGTVDLVARTLTITCAGWQQAAFSTEYYHAAQRVLVPANSPVQGIDDLRGKPVCATTGSRSLATIRAAQSHPVAVAADDWAECLVRFQTGDVDAISADDAILLGLAMQDPNARIVGASLGDAPYGMAVSQAHPDLLRFVNATLEQVRADGRWTASYSRWLGRAGPPPAPPPARYRD